MLTTLGNVAYSNLGREEADAAEKELYAYCSTQHLIADNRRGDGAKSRVLCFLRIRDPETGIVSDWGWYPFDLICQGEKADANWGAAFRHQVVAFSFRWHQGCLVLNSALYEASPGYFFVNLGIQWGPQGDYFPIRDEALFCDAQ